MNVKIIKVKYRIRQRKNYRHVSEDYGTDLRIQKCHGDNFNGQFVFTKSQFNVRQICEEHMKSGMKWMCCEEYTDDIVDYKFDVRLLTDEEEQNFIRSRNLKKCLVEYLY